MAERTKYKGDEYVILQISKTGGFADLRMMDKPYTKIQVPLTELNIQNQSFSNGRQKAQQEIANKWPVLNVVRTMSKSEILKRAKEGRWELQQDLDGKQNGQHVEVRMPNGSRQQIKIEGD